MQPYHQPFNSKLHTDTNSLVNAYLTKPEEISPFITHLAGRKSQKFPLSFASEGMNNTVDIGQDEYKYKITTEVDNTRTLVKDVSVTDPGRGNTKFELQFEDSWFPPDYTLASQSGVFVRIMEGPYEVGSNYGYMVQMMDNDRNAVMPTEDVRAGAKFVKAFAPVETDYSRGNASTWEAPFEIRHKLTKLRKSYNFSGNAQNTVMAFPMKDNQDRTINTWLTMERYKHLLDWKEECETFYTYGPQNYDNQGRTHMLGKNGYPIIVGPGLLDQIIHRDTFSQLTESKLKNIIGQLFYGMTDADQMTVTLYTGSGGLIDFDNAMKDFLNNNVYTQFNDSLFVDGKGRNLRLGGYFRRYQHVLGHNINVVYQPIYDHGPIAKVRNRHPTTGFSLESHRMTFVDNSSYDGQSNIKMIRKKGGEKMWAVSGSVEPEGYETGSSRASDVDGASVHMMKHASICLMRFDTSLDLQCVAS